jgi:hypothetical protein
LACGIQEAFVDGSPLLSGIIGLAGVAVGGLTSFMSTWLTQLSTAREKRRQIEVGKREKLFNEFVIEASRLFAIALGHDKEDIADLVKLYSLIGRMRLICTSKVVEASERTLRMIIETYTAPNLTLQELRTAAQDGGLNPLVDFDEAGREELIMVWRGKLSGVGRF